MVTVSSTFFVEKSKIGRWPSGSGKLVEDLERRGGVVTCSAYDEAASSASTTPDADRPTPTEAQWTRRRRCRRERRLGWRGRCRCRPTALPRTPGRNGMRPCVLCATGRLGSGNEQEHQRRRYVRGARAGATPERWGHGKHPAHRAVVLRLARDHLFGKPGEPQRPVAPRSDRPRSRRENTGVTLSSRPPPKRACSSTTSFSLGTDHPKRARRMPRSHASMSA